MRGTYRNTRHILNSTGEPFNLEDFQNNMINSPESISINDQSQNTNKIILAVSDRLNVSEQPLPKPDPSKIYLNKDNMRKIQRLRTLKNIQSIDEDFELTHPSPEMLVVNFPTPRQLRIDKPIKLSSKKEKKNLSEMKIEKERIPRYKKDPYGQPMKLMANGNFHKGTVPKHFGKRLPSIVTKQAQGNTESP